MSPCYLSRVSCAKEESATTGALGDVSPWQADGRHAISGLKISGPVSYYAVHLSLLVHMLLIYGYILDRGLVRIDI